MINIPDSNLFEITNRILNIDRDSDDSVDLYLAYEEVDQLNSVSSEFFGIHFLSCWPLDTFFGSFLVYWTFSLALDFHGLDKTSFLIYFALEVSINFPWPWKFITKWPVVIFKMISVVTLMAIYMISFHQSVSGQHQIRIRLELTWYLFRSSSLLHPMSSWLFRWSDQWKSQRIIEQRSEYN